MIRRYQDSRRRAFLLPALALGALFVCAALIAPRGAQAADYHVDPVAEKGGDGSIDAPYNNLMAALRGGSVGPGDRVLLHPGGYGVLKLILPDTIHDVVIEGVNTPDPSGDPEGAAWFTWIRVNQATGLTFRRLLVMPDPARPDDRPARKRGLVELWGDGEGLRAEELELRSAPDTELLTWTDPASWNTHAANAGINIRAPGAAAVGNRLTGIKFGIEAIGSRAHVENNLIDLFAGDGLRGIGNDGLFLNNTVQNTLKVNKNHDDGFQSWASHKLENGEKVVSGGVIDGNRIIEWTLPPGHPLEHLRSRLQGIGMFDGIFDGWVIRNNLVIVDHWHGISVYGGRDVQILNNTVLHAALAGFEGPWIAIKPHKNGAIFEGNVVANNIAMSLKVHQGVLTSHNLVGKYPLLVIDNQDGAFVPKPGSKIWGMADPEWATETDIDGRPRPVGAADLGAFQGRR